MILADTLPEELEELLLELYQLDPEWAVKVYALMTMMAESEVSTLH